MKPQLISSDNYFDNINFNDYETESDEETESNKTKNNKSSKTAHIGGFNKVDGFYKFKLKNNEIINIISPLPFCKMFYFIRYFLNCIKFLFNIFAILFIYFNIIKI